MKSHGVQINSDPKKKKTLPWELFGMFEKTQTKNCYRKGFTVDKYKYLVICLQNGNQMK